MNKNHEQPGIHSGEKLPFLNGNNDALFLSRDFWNKIIATAQAVLSTPQWQVTDHGILFDTPVAAAPSAPGVEFALFQIFQRNLGDYLECIKVTSTGLVEDKDFMHLIPVQSSAGGIFAVAKQINMRLAGISGSTVLKETVDGVTMTYSMPNGADNDNNRSSTDGANPKTEWVYPRYATNAEIVGIYTGAFRTAVPIYAQDYLLACKPPGGSGVFVYKGFGDKKDPANYNPIDWVEIGPNRSWVSE